MEKNKDANADNDIMDAKNDSMKIEEKLGREEAEAILNSLKADGSNLRKRQYKVAKKVKREKDW